MNYTIIQGDAFTHIRQSLGDVVITDPPYDAHCHANQPSGTAMKAQVEGGKGGGIPKIEPKFDALSGYEWTRDLVNCVQRWCIMFCTLEAFGELRTIHDKAYLRGAVWYKTNAMGQLTGDRPAASFEGIACLHRRDLGKVRWNGRGSYGAWACAGTRGKKGRHPNEKPLPLALKLVALFSERGEIITDPFCGSAAIGEAALLLGRKYFGIDQDPEWCEKAKKRLESVDFGSMSDEEALGMCNMKGLGN